MVADYLSQNLNWRTGSLTSDLYFHKKQSLVGFIPTCDEVRKPKPESQLRLTGKSVPIQAPLFAHLSLDSLACWKQCCSEQELIFIVILNVKDVITTIVSFLSMFDTAAITTRKYFSGNKDTLIPPSVYYHAFW